MRVARQWSLCHDDALDAYQRALEIFVRRARRGRPGHRDQPGCRVVVKHEALADPPPARRTSVTAEDIDLDGRAPESQRPVDELARRRASG